MIICKHGHPDFPNDWIIVKQSDHDDHSGFIAAHWQWERFWQPWNAQLLTIAVAMHDTGSACWEDYPLINDKGEPWTYWTMPADDHIELHKLGVREARKVHPYVALLISMHVVGIHRDRLHIDPAPNRWHMPEVETPKVNAFVEEQHAIQAELLHELRTRCGMDWSDDALMNDFKLFEVIDILSTQLSASGLADREMTYVPDAQGRPFTFSLVRGDFWEFKCDPFPFAGDRFECPCVGRRVPKRIYRDDNDFRQAWYAAPMITLPYVCTRA
jgi:hypothetical protein